MKHNLIGISGRSVSGKDTLGKLLQLIACNGDLGVYKTDLDFVNGGDYIREKCSNYQIKKFADKLKDMVCLLIGCTREQLEDREFKEKELGEEWNHNKKVWIDKVSGSYTYNYQRLTPRLLLQLLGTQCGREIIHPNLWVTALFADYEGKEDKSKRKYEHIANHKNVIYPSWLVTDVRFPNEAKAIKDRGGLIIRVNRDSGQALIDKGIHIPKWNCTEEHSSETSLDNYDGFGHVIDNNGSIEELVEKVKQLKLV